jgi:Bifunctional DNA primase/polymerase, N-terminal/Primase C terminal 1 (PriCT-1)
MESYTDNASMMQEAALKLAVKRKPVFPCRPDKAPYTRRGFKDATTDPGRVSALWSRYSGAKIGMRTGKVSGVFVVDVDRLEALGELPQELPETFTIRTPSGGLHYYFTYVDGVTNKNGGLPAGIDVRGNGGYVIVPPSEGYSVERRARVADAPKWLLDALRGEPRSSSESCRRPKGSRSAIPDEGEPILEGGRNAGLTRVAGSLKRRGVDGAELEAALLEINERRCSPPLARSEVLAVSKSVDRYPTGAPGPDAATLAEIDRITRVKLDGREWRGVGGKSERSLLSALCQHAREWGSLIPGGVAMMVSIRQLAEKAATSKQGVYNALRRLREGGHVRREDSERSSPKAGRIVLVSPDSPGPKGPGGGRANLDHKPLEGSSGLSGQGLRGVPLTAPRLRWSAAGCLRLGKSSEAVIDALEDAAGTATLEELGTALGTARVRDLRRRVISRLEERGIVTVDGGRVSLVDAWPEALDEERQLSGEVEKSRLDAAKFDREREAYRKMRSPDTGPDTGPSVRDMDAYRATRPALSGDALRAYKAITEPACGPARAYAAKADTDQLAASLAVYFGDYGPADPAGWKRWGDPAARALAVLDGAATRAAA